MLIEGKSAKCSNCKQPLTWLSHVKRYTQPEAIHESDLCCEHNERKIKRGLGQRVSALTLIVEFIDLCFVVLRPVQRFS
jgi:hypothetical protein